MEPREVKDARVQAAKVAAAVLAGQLSPVLGAIELNGLRSSVDVPHDDPDFDTFVLIDSECDGLPIGSVRQYWSPEALNRKEPEVAGAERWAMDTGAEAFKNVVARFEARHQPETKCAVLVRIDTSRIRDWASFHDVFASAFGFPDFYGRNMDAWVDCLTSLDAPADAMTAVHAPEGGVVVLQLDEVDEFAVRCPEQYRAVVECSAFVNWRRLEVGKSAVIALSYHRSSDS